MVSTGTSGAGDISYRSAKSLCEHGDRRLLSFTLRSAARKVGGRGKASITLLEGESSRSVSEIRES